MQFKNLCLFLGIVCFAAACSTPNPTPALLGTPIQSGYPAPKSTSSASPAVGYPGTAVTVTYKDFEITPATLSIPAGSTIEFVIEGAAGVYHRPTNQTEPNIFQAPDQLGNGTTFKQAFAQPGTVTLLCAYHPDMKATLTVTP